MGLLYLGVRLNHLGFRSGSADVHNALDDLLSEEDVKRLVGVGQHGATDAHLMERTGLGAMAWAAGVLQLVKAGTND